MTWKIQDRVFDGTWNQITHFLNAAVGDCSRRQKAELSANKAVYHFIQDLFGRSFFKDPLKAKIAALDEPGIDEAGIVIYRPQIDRAIDKLLSSLPRNTQGNVKHCSSCQCNSVHMGPTDKQKRVVEENIASIYQLAQRFMAIKT